MENPDFYQMGSGKEKYIACDINEVTYKVRIPLHIYKNANEQNLKEYVIKLKKRIAQGIGVKK